MFTAEYEGINSFLVGASKLLLENGVKRTTRGEICWELPAPFIFQIKNPTARCITIPVRGWNIFLAYAESLWLALGRNDISFISHYLNRLSYFSDDGIFMRGGYGPRLRYFNGVANDYKSDGITQSNTDTLSINQIDQYKYVIDCFEKDVDTRQAIINIGDPTKDCYDENGKLKITKDLPCTRVLHFMRDASTNRLNLTVFMRSNDILWGASAVNIFNFTFIQEYFAQLLGMEIGNYYHIANNFHYYEKYRDKLEQIASTSYFEDSVFHYSKSFKNLEEFDNLLSDLEKYESSLRKKQSIGLVDFNDDFFNDWSRILYSFNAKVSIELKNPILNKIIKSKYG
ncbi:MAG: thymidylate synthase [Bacteroidales bacterium]|nr:thymidylate synthase [Bacteroidales bacterium]